MLFINLSNHHSSTWSDEQLAAAKKYGEIIDISFPAIPPNLSANKVEALARAYLIDCIDLSGDAIRVTVHIMGESNFCFILIQMLLKNGYRCLASTTERMVEEVNGQKIVQFQFKQFREYKLIK